MASSNLLKKLMAVRAEVAYMQKDGRNSAQGYNFLSERQITESFKELFDKHRIMFHYSSKITSVQPNASGKQILTGVQVDYEFVDPDTGETVGGTAAGQGTDANDKGVYKAITGAIKYVFMKTFMIPTGDDPEDDSKDPEARKAKKKDEASYGTSMGTDKPPFGPGSDEDED